MRRLAVLLSVLTAAVLLAVAATQSFTFAIIGDRTGFAQTGVYQHVWREIDRLNPAFAINVGDSIQGGDNRTAAAEWEEIAPLFKHRFPFYPVPGNHDIWSPESERVWRSVTQRAPFYSFDYQGAHFTVLDNSRTTDLSPQQMSFLASDLALHKQAAPKLIFFHKPFWLTPVLFRNPDFPLHKLAKEYGVAAIINGHVHNFAYWRLDGIQYVLAGSSGGQLRSDRFSEGWFFQWIEARVRDGAVELIVHELPAPYGEGRTFPAAEWSSRSQR